MLDREQVIEKMQQGGKLDICAQYEGVTINGIAAVDAVIGTRGKVKMRARFGHGIKAVFELGEYGEQWRAAAVTEEQPAAEEQRQDTPRDAATICGSASAEAVNRDRTKGRPTPKRQQPTKAEKEAARQRYKRHLMERLCKWCPWDAASWDEYDRLEGLADMIADAVSADSRVIMVNGCSLTAAQYWYMVQNIEYSHNIADMFDRIKSAEVCSGVRNTRAYTLAAVYNAVQWDSVMRGADVKTEALYRASAYGA